ncbi:hypothetical protein [Dongia sedimenti]|uniref:Uncharacterized protein n=1 Tax=Dongia sedimenti TaxID=3064282 RepID=A0ABU0YK46_9PROT|nr:hypothetical protein [Rhodospirillaceae bacterium R-7]
MTVSASAGILDMRAAELQLRIPDLIERIHRQEKRIQKIKITGAGPCDEMEALLVDMEEYRDAMQARLAAIEAATVQRRRAMSGGATLRLVPVEDCGGSLVDTRTANKGWNIELFRGGVRLRRLRPRR